MSSAVVSSVCRNMLLLPLPPRPEAHLRRVVDKHVERSTVQQPVYARQRADSSLDRRRTADVEDETFDACRCGKLGAQQTDSFLHALDASTAQDDGKVVLAGQKVCGGEADRLRIRAAGDECACLILTGSVVISLCAQGSWIGSLLIVEVLKGNEPEPAECVCLCFPRQHNLFENSVA